MREEALTLTPTLSLGEGEEAISFPSPPEGERDRVRGTQRSTALRGPLVAARRDIARAARVATTSKCPLSWASFTRENH
jgi:hypothetical protein